ncbi:MAG: hypothetical protein AAB481_02975 [Patescibacteria group bacterium]
MINTDSVIKEGIIVPPKDPPKRNGVPIFIRTVLVAVGIMILWILFFNKSRLPPKVFQSRLVEPQSITVTPDPCRTFLNMDSVPCQIVIVFDYQKTKKATQELTKAFIKKLLSGVGYDLIVKQIIASGTAPIQVIISTPYQEEDQIGRLLIQKYPEYIVSQNRIKLSRIQGE